MIIRRQDIHLLLQKLWTKAVGSDSYDKHEWIELESKIIELIEGKRGMVPCIHYPWGCPVCEAAHGAKKQR